MRRAIRELSEPENPARAGARPAPRVLLWARRSADTTPPEAPVRTPSGRHIDLLNVITILTTTKGKQDTASASGTRSLVM